MYKAGRRCSDADAAAELCCTTEDKEVFANVWSLRSTDGTNSMLSSDQAEVKRLSAAGGGFVEQCNPVPGPTAFCVNASLVDGREGPFMVYSKPVPDNPTRPLYRCKGKAGHFFSADQACEGSGTMEHVLGHVAKSPGGEMLRALRRCKGAGGRRMHALDLRCDEPDGGSEPLGYVR